MSSLAFLVTELQSLASETRRKHPEVREAAEKSLAILRSSSEQATSQLASDGPQSQDLLRPFFMGCAIKNAKVVAISLGSLQRLIALQAVPQSLVALIIKTMNDCVSQGVDIQLRILQTLLSLITNFPSVHGELLGDALILCFRLQESRIAVVSSTAAATLRQLVMFVVDKVLDEDRKDSSEASQMADIQLPDGSKKSLGPSARDAFSVIEDLCLLANAERPHFLKLDSLPKTFALELIESVLTNYHELFRKHNELLALLQHHLCPLLLKTLSDRPIFPLTLRSTRVVFLLLKQFSVELITEAEVFLTLLIRTVGGEMDPATGAYSSENNPAHGARPHWMRVLAMEIIRGLCNDAELMRGVWNRYDAQNAGSKVFTSLITALKRLVTEKPALLGVSTQMFGIGVASNSSESSGLPTSGSGGSGYGFDLGSVAGMVANAASATVSGVVGMMGTEHGLSVAGSAMKLQCIDQLDKADSPSIPESYIYLLGLQCLVSLCEGFATITLPLYNSIVIQKPRAAGDAVTRAPPALDLASLPAEQPSTKQLQTVHDMVASGWPGLLAALSFIVATNLSDDLFADVLQSYQNMANVSGMLGLTTPRDAFLTSLAKFAIPSRVVSSLDSYIEPSTPRSASGVISENLGIGALGGVTQQAPGLSERNMACLKVLASCALFLAGSLGSSWFDVLEALQNADYVLNAKGSRSAAAKRSSFVPPTGQSPSRSGSLPPQGPVGTGVGAAQPRHNLLTDIDTESVSRAIQRLFDSTKNLEDQAFKDFVAALCRLSSEMVDMQSDSNSIIIESQSEDSVQGGGLLSPSIEASHRRRASGIHLPRTLRTGDFGINRLGNVALLNVHRLIYRPPDVAWNALTSHLVSVLRHPSAPHSIRLQAARALDEILVVVPRNITSTGDLQAEVQTRVLDVLAQQVAPDTAAGNTPTVVDIRRMGLETLHQILQSSGHTLVVGWETIFDMLGSVCEPSTTIPESLSVESTTSQSTGVSPRGKPLPLGYSNDRGNASLVRIAFQSLTLVCDSLSTLSPEHLRLCISTLGKFGRQRDTNIALTAAGSLLWGVSDSIQAKRRDETQEPAYSALWMFLLLEVPGLCTDSRAEVRVGGIQTLFRTLQLYGATLSLETWDECLWKVTFPLLDSISSVMRQMPPPTGTIASVTDQSSADYPSRSWDESKILALQSIGSIFGDFLVLKIMHLPSFEKVWDSFVQHVQESFLLDRPAVSTAALRCLERGLRSSSTASGDLTDKVSVLWQRSWRACDDMGGAVLRRASAQSPETESDDGGNFLPFDQESLLALVDVVQCTRSVSRAGKEADWPLDQLTRLMVILKGVLTYPNSPIYRADIDALTPVQTAVMDAILAIDLSVPKSPSLVIRDLSEFATLPFIASFDVHDTAPNPNNRPQSRVTYIGLTKKVMPMLVELFLRFKGDVDLYVDETLEAILSAYSVPIKLKYDCPPPSKFGNDLPLWKTATSCFLRIIKESTAQLRILGHSIPDERIEGIWRKVVDVFRAGILADCTAAEAFTLEEQEAEENFDLSLVASLEVDVVPLLGDPRVPDYLIIHLAKFLHQGSCIYDFSSGRGPFSPGQARTQDSEEVGQNEEFIGSTTNGQLLPRERFSYWCFDLLFLICSDAAKDQESHRRRVAALSLPSLLQRCRTTLLSYVADEAVRGNYPFPRAREEEVVYVLRKLLTLRLWTGSLWAALSESPSKHAAEQPPTDLSLSQSSIISDATKRSKRAHLLHFYSVFCQIASLPRTTPTAWTTENKPQLPDDPSLGMVDAQHSRVAFTAQNGVSVEYDIRDLGRSCLVEIGKAIGIE